MRFQKNNPMRLFYGALFLVFLALGISGCSKETNYERFSLTKFNGAVRMVHADTSVTFSWGAAFTAWEGDRDLPDFSYEITIAKDADFRDVDAITIVQDSLTLTIGKERLTPLVEYYARVRVLGGGPRVNSSEWVSYNSSNGRTFHVLSEINYFKQTKVGDLIDVAARLRWSTAKELVDRIVVKSLNSNISKQVTLTEEEKNAGVAIVDGLVAGEEYLAELYLVGGNGTVQRRGRQVFFTKPDVTGAGYTDLRGSGDALILFNTLPNATAGTKLVLKRGMTYNIPSSYRIDRPVTIMSEPGFGPQARIQMSSSFSVAEGSAISLLKFEDVEIRGTIGSTYVFNLSPASTIEKIEFEACRISDHVGVTRLQGAGAKYLKDYVINNSIVENIGAQGLLQVDHADVIVNNIYLTNSTFINAEWIIRCNASVRTDLNTMYVENSTFFRAPYNNRFILDIARTGSTIGSFTINNTLFGFTEGGRSFNTRTPTSVSGANSFATSDAIWGTSATQALTAAGIARYTGTSEQVFVAPDKVNFTNSDLTIKDAALFTVGDPRWRP